MRKEYKSWKHHTEIRELGSKNRILSLSLYWIGMMFFVLDGMIFFVNEELRSLLKQKMRITLNNLQKIS